MKRITIKNKQFNDYSVAEELRRLDVRDYLYNINQKMGEYEDIEEELGIDLIKLFRALYEGIYYKKNNQMVYDKAVRLYNENMNMADRPKFKGLYGSHSYVLFSDYGKTWALTKEELEK